MAEGNSPQLPSIEPPPPVSPSSAAAGSSSTPRLKPQASSPKPSSPLAKLRLYASMIRYGRAHNRDFAREHCQFFQEMIADLSRRLPQLRGLRALEVGCGKSAWLTLLMQSYGINTTGIDIEHVEGRGLGKYWGILRRNGPERAARTLAWEWLFARPYFREMEKQAGFPLRFAQLDARQMSVTELAFPEQHFDLIVSHEVFEHLPDLAAAAASLRRALKPDGLTYIYVHNYASVSGGHHIAWKYPDSEPSDTVPPWDHLRQNRFPDIPSWINRFREADYRRAFEAEFAILDWLPRGREGQKLLTPEIRVELGAYSEAELLTKGFVIIARPKPKLAGNQLAPAPRTGDP